MNPGVHEMLVAISISSAAKAVSYFRSGVFSLTAELSDIGGRIGSFNPDLGHRFDLLIAKATSAGADQVSAAGLRTPQGALGGPPELAAIFHAERGDFVQAQQSLDEAFTSMGV